MLQRYSPDYLGLTACNNVWNNWMDFNRCSGRSQYQREINRFYPAWVVADLGRAILLGSRSCEDVSVSIECGCFRRSSYILAAKTLAVEGPKMPSEFTAFTGLISEGWEGLFLCNWACRCCINCNCCICNCCWCSLALICWAYQTKKCSGMTTQKSD